MTGTSGDIEIFRPFGDAYELMTRILFRPFDFTKWCVIGFAAFLAHLGGGYNINPNYSYRGNDAEGHEMQSWLAEQIREIPNWIWIAGIVVCVIIVLAIILVVGWLRARGRFMFIDCIVKNRGAIAEPWREFKTLANSYFLFSLVVGCVFVAFGAVLGFAVAFRDRALHAHAEGYFVAMLIFLGAIVVLLAILWALIAQLTVPIMYRRRCRAPEAARIAFSLITNHPGEITLYCLFWIVLFLAAAMVSCLSICATCCLTMIPYVGTVILLPLLVCLRAFSLFFLRQFGPDYDVWATLEPPPIPEPPLPEPPPLQTEPA